MTQDTIKQSLEEHFNEILDTHMAGMSMINPALHVEATDVQDSNHGRLCVLVTPWFMSLMLLPGKQSGDVKRFTSGETRSYDFPSGRYEFTMAIDKKIGPYESCSLFAPMSDFESHDQALKVAHSILASLMREPGSEVADEKTVAGSAQSPSRRDLFRAAFRRGRNA